jgi:hypothetical protein
MCRLTLWAAAGAVLLCGGGAWARQATIVTKAGATVTGEVVTEDDKNITLAVAGINTVFPRAEVASEKYTLPPVEEYLQRRGKLRDDDIDGRLTLCEWLYGRGLLAQAKQELADLTQRAPANDDVSLLARLVDKAGADAAAATAPAAPVAVVAAAAPAAEPKMLTPVDINIIKIWESDLRTRPRVLVPDPVIDTLFTRYADAPVIRRVASASGRDAFRTMEGWAQLEVIFDAAAGVPAAQKVRDLYSRIVMVDDPPIIKTFRRFHTNYVVGYCATADCHGGAKGGSLFLFNRDPGSDATVYTNFYILRTYATRRALMIDADRPEQSLLIQEGMAQANAVFPHPAVPGWRQSFVNAQDGVARRIGAWIVNEVEPWPAKYPVRYTPPVPGAADNPYLRELNQP